MRRMILVGLAVAVGVLVLAFIGGYLGVATAMISVPVAHGPVGPTGPQGTRGVPGPPGPIGPQGDPASFEHLGICVPYGSATNYHTPPCMDGTQFVQVGYGQ